MPSSPPCITVADGDRPPVRRIVVIDPSLRDHVGHCIEYDRALQAAAHAQGLAFCVLAHREAPLAFPEESAFLPTFSSDMWGERPVQADATVRAQVRLQRAAAAALSLSGRIGEQTARGRSTGRLGTFALMRHPAFFIECRRALQRVCFGAGDLAFCHMVVHRNILECAELACRLTPAPLSPLVLLFRYPAAFYQSDRPSTRLALQRLRRAWDSGRVRLSTDSARLADEYAALTDIPFEVFPIPHAGPVLRRPAGQHRVLRLGSLGNPRGDKGFLALADALFRLAQARPALPLQVVIQVHHPAKDCVAAVERLRTAGLAQLTLIEDALSSADYADLLASFDAVLLAYPRDEYRSRTSGVFIEAVAAGKPVLVTDGTWMADELRRWGAGVLIDEATPAAIASGIGALVREIAALRARAEATAPACVEHHSPLQLLRCLLMPADPAAGQ